MTKMNLGKVTPAPRGEYDAGVLYSRLDIVNFQGAGYMALDEVQGIEPPDPAHWQLMAGRGVKGEPGERGEQGEKGEIGERGENEYAYVFVDRDARAAFGILRDGSVSIGKCRRYPLGDSILTVGEEDETGYAFSLLDKNQTVSEFALSHDGTVPDWVLERWRGRMGVAAESLEMKRIVCWGDSLTAGAGGGGTSYPAVLQAKLGNDWAVLNMGVGGETSLTISARQGGNALSVVGITIPAGATAVQIGDYANGIRTELGGIAHPLRQGSNGVNPVTLAGIPGTLSITQTSSTSNDAVFFFSRLKAGSAVTLTSPACVVTNAMKAMRGGVAVLFIGQNGGWSTPDELVAQLRHMIGYGRYRDFLCVGLHTGTASSRAALEAAMLSAFGRRYLNLREYMAKYALADAGLTPTATDSEAMGVGSCPPSLLADTVHFNAVGYTLLGNLIHKRLTELEAI